MFQTGIAPSDRAGDFDRLLEMRDDIAHLPARDPGPAGQAVATQRGIPTEGGGDRDVVKVAGPVQAALHVGGSLHTVVRCQYWTLVLHLRAEPAGRLTLCARTSSPSSRHTAPFPR
jgi:hypothetical protein